MVNVNLYQYSGKNNVINKTLENPQNVSGLLIEPFNVLHPTLKFRCVPPINYNYVFITELNRYYFIDNTEILNAVTVLLSLRLDVLKSYENSILEATATITQKENANAFISDRRKIYDIRPKFERIEFTENEPFKRGDIVMLTLKGNTNINPQNI